MKLNLYTTLVLAGAMSFSVGAQQFPLDTKSSEPPDKEKLSYALGMNLGLQLKKAGMDVDAKIIAAAISDVLEGKPTKLQESEIRPIFTQAQAYGAGRKSGKSKLDGNAFLAKNAAAPGVTVMPDGLQYRVLKEGAGATPAPTNVLVLNFRGLWVDGTEFRHKDKLQIAFRSCPKDWQEVLPLMKVGSKWQIVAPPEVAFRQKDERVGGYGSVLVYELELVSDQPDPAGNAAVFPGGRLGHAPDEDFLPPANSGPR